MFIGLLLLPRLGHSQSAYDYYTKAYDYFKNKDYQSAIYYCKKSIEADASYYSAYGLLGDCYYNQDQFNLAVQNYTEALRSTSMTSESEAYYFLSRAYAREKLADYDGAISDYGSCINRYAKEYSGSAYWGRGVLYANKKANPVGAKTDFESALSYFRDDRKSLSTLYANISDCELKAGNYQVALEKAEQAIQYDPDNFDGYRRQGNAYMSLDKYKEGKVSFSKALKLIQGNAEEVPSQYRNLAVCQYQLDEFDEAIPNLMQAVALKSNFRQAYWDLAWVYHQKGDYKNAVNYYTKTITFYLDDPGSLWRLYRWRGKSYYFQDDYSHALQDYQLAMKVADTSDYHTLYDDIAMANFYNGNITAALTSINKAFTIKAGSTHFYDKLIVLAALRKYREIITLIDAYPDAYSPYYMAYLRGYYNWKQNNIADATIDFDRFNTLVQDKPNANVIYKCMYLVFKGRKAEAISLMNAQIESSIDKTRDIYDLACVYAMSGNGTEAIRQLENAINLGYKNTRWMQLDYDLQSIQQRPEFIAMLKKHKVPVIVRR